MMSLEDFDYELPEALIAQAPVAKRSASRLLLLPRRDGLVADRTVRELPELLQPGDLLVANDTQVLRARMVGHKRSGGRAEIVLERLLDEQRALALVGTNKRVKPGTEIVLQGDGDNAGESAIVTVVARHDDMFEVEASTSWRAIMARYGELPLPPYIRRAAQASDEQRYQTLFASAPGAVAAPTAGLHFDTELLEAIATRGVHLATITLHVGAGTFQPVRGSIDDHTMHRERYFLTADVAARINATKRAGGRIVAVGTTVVRALESAAHECGSGPMGECDGDTDLFITPGFDFRVIDALMTNFHLPRTTLMMLVSAFCTRERLLNAYRHAVASKYRFFSYGDAMLIA
jgi:S-adenosylmethionine:tRNA ribosyltransferase-isomerase